MTRTLLDYVMRLLTGVGVMMMFGCAALKAQEGRTAGADAPKPPYNMVFVIVDQRTYKLLAGSDYSLPALDAIARHGVTFKKRPRTPRSSSAQTC